MTKIIEVQHKGSFTQMRRAAEEPRAIKAHTEETSNMLKAHQSESKNVKLTGGPGGGQPQPCHVGQSSSLGYQERLGRGMGGQVCRILKIQGQGVLCMCYVKGHQRELEEEREDAREHLFDDVEEGRLSL